MKIFSKCPLLICIAFSAFLLNAAGRCNLNGTYREYEEAVAGKPALAAVFMGAKEQIYFWEERMEPAFSAMDADTVRFEDDSVYADPEGLDEPEGAQNDASYDDGSGEKADQNGSPGDQNDGTENSGDAQNTPGDDAQPDENAEPERYDFVTVEDDYFDDALFIGDSRTQGMFEYGGLEERAAFYCRTSLTIYDLFEKEKEFIRIGDEKLTLAEALEREQFGKIYLMLGVNELGTGTPESFLRSYSAAVEEIRALQPDAVIFVQAIMRVAGEKSASDPIYNNENINIRNELLSGLADEKNIFYVDVNEAVCDENGDLHGDWTFDQIHLKAKYYEVWKNFLKEHGIEKNLSK